MHHFSLILNVLALLGILTGAAAVSHMGAFAHQPVALVLITGSLG